MFTKRVNGSHDGIQTSKGLPTFLREPATTTTQEQERGREGDAQGDERDADPDDEGVAPLPRHRLRSKSAGEPHGDRRRREWPPAPEAFPIK